MFDNVFYRLGDKLYVNITNRCSCDCTFCIRRNGDSVGDADTLWLEREPTIDEIKSAFDGQELSQITEIVFCGYGEPMERAEDVIQICNYIKSKTDLQLRLNTNGLVKLINPEFKTAHIAVMDTVSISLNADNAADYQKFSRTVFGEPAFDSLLEFAEEIKPYTNVFFTIVNVPGVKIEKCKIISEKLKIPLRIRSYER